MKTLKEVEIEHILEALRLTNGKVSGEDGAARLLGINPKTLDSKIRKLGIKKVLDIQHPGTS
ncbi:MAG TPA: helix-turn-helix domain-containing protein [Bacteroidales bacterium]|jgi:transcriptional regulator with GAF, ATPase, and Fis domain|nr:helix-turn-helix domain-containing protein [Bacteroidales bacterium]